jgi:hypothetical protein
MVWATFWAIFSQTHLVALVGGTVATRAGVSRTAERRRNLFCERKTHCPSRVWQRADLKINFCILPIYFPNE